MGDQLGLFRAPAPAAIHTRDAVLSADGVYRYELRRTWDDDLAPTAFVMLNPSTADATVDDPTIRRCMGFARSWGAGGIIVVNLYAFRATDPRELVLAVRAGIDIVGAENDARCREVFRVVDGIVCAWGAGPGGPCDVASAARRLLALVPAEMEVSHLGLTKDGHPRHPLYLAATTPRERFRGYP